MVNKFFPNFRPVGAIKEEGVSLYLVLIILGVLLALALGISTIFLGQTKMIREMGNSVVAFYAADTGIEEVLMNQDNPVDIPETILPNGAKYEVFVIEGNSQECPALNYCIRSIGTYQKTKRAIEITY